ncbi:forkhead box protein J1-A-like [Arapaima gigas]
MALDGAALLRRLVAARWMEAMLCGSSADCWPEIAVGLEEEVVTAVTQKEMQDSGSCFDDSLTNLQWLQEFSIVDAQEQGSPLSLWRHHHQGPPQFLNPEAPTSPLAGEPASAGTFHTPGTPTAAAYSRVSAPRGASAATACGDRPTQLSCSTNPYVKPPYSYATLICMAMQSSNKPQVSLSYIYKWIQENFLYFRYADSTWQNSVRHNLSLNKCFIRVPRQKHEPGKGGYWTMDPQYAEQLLSGAVRRHRSAPVRGNPTLRLPAKQVSQPLLQGFQGVTETGLSANAQPTGGKLPERLKNISPAACKALTSQDPQFSTSPLLSADEPSELGSLRGVFDSDDLLRSGMGGDLSLDMVAPQSPIPWEEEQEVTYASFAQSSTFLDPLQSSLDLEDETPPAQMFLQSPWAERDDSEGVNDLLGGPAVSLDQLFDLGE